MKNFTFSLIMMLCSFVLRANIISVPANFATIQGAINAAADGDTVEVQPGVYFENINFRGKKIVVTSLFYLANDTSYIGSTIINGSQPAFADTASCVLIVSGEDSTTVLQGFTITGGNGTRWLDEHGAGTYREGGGILIAESSPVIRFNVIKYNYATVTTGSSGAGGGGLRIGDGNPRILNNNISYNQARYGPGIVLNYTGAIIKNNLIAYNTGGQSYNGGGAIWGNNSPASGLPKIIENNTIFSNHATVGTGGVLNINSSMIIRNNILWRNSSAVNNSQVYPLGALAVTLVTYSDIQGGYAGSGNSDTDPLFTDTVSFLLQPLSPCIDAGDSSVIYNDIENPSLPGFALLPSLGTLRNDMGAYGGQGTASLAQGQVTGMPALEGKGELISIYPNPAHSFVKITGGRSPILSLELCDVSGKNVWQKTGAFAGEFILDTQHMPRGIYFLKIKLKDSEQVKKIVLE